MCVCIVNYSVIYHIHRHRDRVHRRPMLIQTKWEIQNAKQINQSQRWLEKLWLKRFCGMVVPSIFHTIHICLTQTHWSPTILRYGWCNSTLNCFNLATKKDHHQFTQSVIKQRLMSVLHAVRPCANVWLEWFNMLSQRSINEAKAHLIRCISHGHNEREWAPSDSHFTVHQTWLKIS